MTAKLLILIAALAVLVWLTWRAAVALRRYRDARMLRIARKKAVRYNMAAFRGTKRYER